ncbi:MAG TPA: hypothetical protein PKV16_08675 [Caldisericia bacterium]|nr:hypothetical protein [Caldisericia bacterium]HPF49611.1 hypothetical protein [Caldisericia bacterium]HPI84473.1 hypothetical protein [Caldisericia bacterium]HPQ93839.1 hypothetical protein [Caldisericia bacterium]HRV75384.1 hypothetical protein [Caldisericia bacterium]
MKKLVICLVLAVMLLVSLGLSIVVSSPKSTAGEVYDYPNRYTTLIHGGDIPYVLFLYDDLSFEIRSIHDLSLQLESKIPWDTHISCVGDDIFETIWLFDDSILFTSRCDTYPISKHLFFTFDGEFFEFESEFFFQVIRSNGENIYIKNQHGDSNYPCAVSNGEVIWKKENTQYASTPVIPSRQKADSIIWLYHFDEKRTFGINPLNGEEKLSIPGEYGVAVLSNDFSVLVSCEKMRSFSSSGYITIKDFLIINNHTGDITYSIDKLDFVRSGDKYLIRGDQTSVFIMKPERSVKYIEQYKIVGDCEFITINPATGEIKKGIITVPITYTYENQPSKIGYNGVQRYQNGYLFIDNSMYDTYSDRYVIGGVSEIVGEYVIGANSCYDLKWLKHVWTIQRYEPWMSGTIGDFTYHYYLEKDMSGNHYYKIVPQKVGREKVEPYAYYLPAPLHRFLPTKYGLFMFDYRTNTFTLHRPGAIEPAYSVEYASLSNFTKDYYLTDDGEFVVFEFERIVYYPEKKIEEITLYARVKNGEVLTEEKYNNLQK